SKIIPEQSRVGCFAEGEGRNAVYLAKLGHQVTAYDQSTMGLDKTEDLAHKNDVQVETIAMDLTNEKVPTIQCDAAIVVCRHVLKDSQSFLLLSMIASVTPSVYILIDLYSENNLSSDTCGPK